MPDGGATYFHGEKGTTYEGGMRVPQLVRWPGTIKPGTKINDIMGHQDWIPTLPAAAGDDKAAEKLAFDKGATYNGKRYVHLDGYNFLPYFQGKEEKGLVTACFTSANAELNAVRWNDFKILIRCNGR